jgi:hypothetical protein
MMKNVSCRLFTKLLTNNLRTFLMQRDLNTDKAPKEHHQGFESSHRRHREIIEQHVLDTNAGKQLS